MLQGLGATQEKAGLLTGTWIFLRVVAETFTSFAIPPALTASGTRGQSLLCLQVRLHAWGAHLEASTSLPWLGCKPGSNPLRDREKAGWAGVRRGRAGPGTSGGLPGLTCPVKAAAGNRAVDQKTSVLHSCAHFASGHYERPSGGSEPPARRGTGQGERFGGWRGLGRGQAHAVLVQQGKVLSVRPRC